MFDLLKVEARGKSFENFIPLFEKCIAEEILIRR